MQKENVRSKSVLGRKAVAILLLLAMLFTLVPQFSAPVFGAEEMPTFTTTNTADTWNRSTGLANTCAGRAALALYYNGSTFPGEPRVHYGGGYVTYNTSLEKGSANLKASELLKDVIGSPDYVFGDGWKWGSSYMSATSGIFDPNGLDDEYFTDEFRAALAIKETDMIQDVLDARGTPDDNPADYEIVWYVIKFQSADTKWHINGLIREKDKYAVIYDGNGHDTGSPPDGQIDMSYSEAQNYTVQNNENGLARSGHDFIGWNTKADGSGVFYTGGQKADLTLVGESTVTLYAQWAADRSITWKDGNGQTIHLDTDHQNGDTVTYDGVVPTKNPTAEYEYVWDGWSTSAGGAKVYDKYPTITVNGDMTFYAHFYTQERTYTVTWVNQTVIHTDTGLGYGDTVVYDGIHPTRTATETEGYFFEGWSTTEEGTKQYDQVEAIPVTGDMTLYAVFEKVPFYNVNWMSEDGNTTLEADKTLQGYSAAFNGTEPTKAGHIFDGWSTVKGGEKVYDKGESFTVSQNTNLYAHFSANKYTVKWISEGSLLKTDTVSYGVTPTAPADPKKAQDAQYTYTFAGWDPEVSAVTGDVTYTAVFTPVLRSYDVVWKNWDSIILKSEKVNYGVTPSWTGSTPTRPETETQTWTFIGWDPTVSAVPGNADGSGVITYTAVFSPVDKLFPATVNVWKNPAVDGSGNISGGTKISLADALGQPGVEMYLQNVADASDKTRLDLSGTGTYTLQKKAGTYKVVYADGTEVTSERIILPLDTRTDDPDSTTADILFYTVTYDANGGTVNGQDSLSGLYQRGTVVYPADYTPVLAGYDFLGWVLDPAGEVNADSPVVSAGNPITDPGAGIAQTHVLKAKWTKALRADVTVNVTIHHHNADQQGTNPEESRNGALNIDLLHREIALGGDYYEKVGFATTSTNWYTTGTTTESEAGGKVTSTTVVSSAYTASGLPNDWEYSANAVLDGYWRVGDPVITKVQDGDGNWSYTVDITLQYRPDLFNMTVQVIADPSIPADLIPKAVDLKFLSWDANVSGKWAPITRHENSTLDVQFNKDLSEGGQTYANRQGTASYPMPVYKAGTTTPWYYRAAVAGFTLPDNTELSASPVSDADLNNYSSDAAVPVGVYSYADGAYYAVVSVAPGVESADGSGNTGIRGEENGLSWVQDGSVIVRIYADPHTVTLDPMGGTISGSASVIELEDQFRTPDLSTWVPARTGGYLFEGWYYMDNGVEKAAVSHTAIDSDVTLYAKWKEPLTIEGYIGISKTYTIDGKSYDILDHSLPQELEVTLERTYYLNGAVELIQEKIVTGLDFSTWADQDLGVVHYAFDPVPLDGSTYRVYVNLKNYEESFLVEPNSNTDANFINFGLYGASSQVVDADSDNTAVVHAYLQFDPDIFNLTWKIDSSQIGVDHVPDSLDVVIQADTSLSAQPETWPVISQHYQPSTGTWTPENTPVDPALVVIDGYLVWNTDTQGDKYYYAVKPYAWYEKGNKTLYDANAPFSVVYDPSVAWYEGGKQVTSNADESSLLMTLVPNKYQITYNMNAGYDRVTSNGWLPSTHTWSFDTPIPTDLVREGYDFLGWTCSVDGAYHDSNLDASLHQNVTLTANWKPQKSVTFKVVNGTWANGESTPQHIWVSLKDGPADTSALIPTGMIPAYGYEYGSWDVVPPASFSDDSTVTYTYTFARDYVNISYDADDPASDGFLEGFDTIPYGDYIRVNPNGGNWIFGGNPYNSVQNLMIEEDTNLANPVRDQYIFMGWSHNYLNEIVNGRELLNGYTAVWAADANGDSIPDAYQKKVTFKVENGFWNDGAANDDADRIYYITLLDSKGDPSASGTGSISSVIPESSKILPRVGFLKDGAFWSPALPADGKVSGLSEVTYTYRHYTTITFADYAQGGAEEVIHVLPGSGLSADPNGGALDGVSAPMNTMITGAYVLEEPTYADHEFQGWSWTPLADGSGHSFVAQWELLNYEILWKNWDGSILETDPEVPLGTMPTYDGETPVKEGNAEFTYEFRGWDPQVVKAEGDQVYTAVFEEVRNTYTVTWQNHDGSEMEKDLLVPYGTVPSFDSPGKITVEDANHDYAFLGWYLSTDDTKTVLDLSAQTVTGDVTYAAKYDVTPKARLATINLWSNATGALGMGGTLEAIDTVTNGEAANLYLVPVLAGGTLADPAQYIAVDRNAAGAYSKLVAPGTYQIYAGDTAGSAVSIAQQQLIIGVSDETIHIYYNSVTYRTEKGSFEGGKTELTEYYKAGSGPIQIRKMTPTNGSYVFTHWEDQNGNSYNAANETVPVTLTASIVQKYVLTAQWVEEAQITVTVNMDHRDGNGNLNPNRGEDMRLDLSLTRSTTEHGTYSTVFGTASQVPYEDWNNGADASSYVYTFTGQPSGYYYQAVAQLAGYTRTGIAVNGNNITIDLKYDPEGFDLVFHVETAAGVPDSLVPQAVDVQLVYYDRAAGQWTVVPTFEDRSIEVALTKDIETGIWKGTGTYHVWGEYTTAGYEGQLYLYRVAIADFNLGTMRGSLDAVSGTGSDAFKTYSSAVGTFHPAGAYTASVAVTDLACDQGLAAGLKGAHNFEGAQHGTILVTVDVNPYTVVQKYLDGTTPDTVQENLFIMPSLGAAPVRSGCTFDGWWTKDGSVSGDWGEPAATAGAAIMDQAQTGDTLTLYAKWNQDLTVTGQINVHNWYELAGEKIYLPDNDRPDSVTVQLVQGNALPGRVIATQTIPVTDHIHAGETAATADHRIGTYTFTNVPDDGLTYWIRVTALNFDAEYQNEPASIGADALNHDQYTKDMDAILDSNGDDLAVVNACMVFEPADFDLEFTVDASAIKDGFRPQSAGLVVICNDRDPSESASDPSTWPIITQQQQGSDVDPYNVTIGSNGLAQGSVLSGSLPIWHKFPVWQSHPSNYYYAYAAKAWTVTFGSETYTQSNMAEAPFTATCIPTSAWYDAATGKQTSPGARLMPPDSANPSGLVVFLTPKTYEVTYELGRPGTVAGAAAVDSDTAKGSYLWSEGLATLPAASGSSAFDGWFSKDGSLTGDWGEPITAIDAASHEDITLYARWKYTITWKNWDGSNLEVDQNVVWGTSPSYDSEDPSRPSSEQYEYVWMGWHKDVEAVDSDEVYYASYLSVPRTYEVLWKNWDGTVLETDPSVAYGTTPNYDGAVPEKAADAQYTYTFTGWSPAISAVTGNVEYTAQFSSTVNAYTVTWKNWDGFILDMDTAAYGSMPNYEGTVPVKAGDAQYTWTFTGWSPAVAAVNGPAEYQATFSSTVNT
ncbi:MAG: InlB B-repeat-containing protein, partial [Firmicutes bacterium]|nr:InlB B-repeat-containing protein [Bacillota bacterium]